jgi:aminomethyltransferase
MSSCSALKRTPLYAEHVRIGGKMVPFGGWEMPVQYSGIIDEHQAVRSAAGVFDISHMGEIFVSGPGAVAWLNRMLTNDVTRLAQGECQYTLMLNEGGGVIDDLIIYHIAPGEYLLVVNASKIDEDFAWLREHLPDGVACMNRSDDFAGIAVQGPLAPGVFGKIFPGAALPAHNRIAVAKFQQHDVFVARTGYTGEDGFELFIDAACGAGLWNAVIAAGARPCGLGARDTLRLEMCYPLNGSDLSPAHTPLEAGLGFFVSLDKGAFTGRDVLLRQKSEGLSRRLAAFRMTEKGPPPRPHYTLWHDGAQIGEACSASLSPTLGTGIGMAYLPAEFSKPGTGIKIEIRGRRFAAVVKKKPLHRK